MIDALLQPLLPRLYPGLDALPPRQREVMRFNLSTVLVTAPLALLALAWLAAVTDTAVLRRHAGLLLLHLALLLLLNRYPFALQFELRRGFFVSMGGSLALMVVLAAAFLVGPTALWLSVILVVGTFLLAGRRAAAADATRRWNDRVTLLMSLGYGLTGSLAGLAVYAWLGGRYPLADLNRATVGPALAALAVLFAVPTLLSLPRVRKLAQLGGGAAPRGDMLRFAIASSALTFLQYPFSLLAAALWSRQGVGWYLFFMAGAWLAAVMAHRLSQSVARSEQRARELAMLEQLGQALIAAPADASTLPDLVAQHVEGMLPGAFLLIWLAPDQVLFRSERASTESWAALPEKLAAGDLHLWRSAASRRRRDCLLAAIRNDEQALLGGVFVQLGSYREEDTADFLPVVQSLAGQIASAVQRAHAYRQALAHARMTRELQVAWEIQASLLRTYARQYPDQPARVFAATNARILADTDAGQFVTLFYAVLDPAAGELVYANAGHNPALLLPAGDGTPAWLPNSGPPLGVMENLAWRERRFSLAAGDRLLLYTDGVTEAQNEAQEFFTEARLLQAARAEETAEGVQTAVLTAVTQFSGQAPQFDDITLLTLLRR